MVEVKRSKGKVVLSMDEAEAGVVQRSAVGSLRRMSGAVPWKGDKQVLEQVRDRVGAILRPR